MAGGKGRILDYRADGKAAKEERQKPNAVWHSRMLGGLALGGALALGACGGSAYSSLPWSANTRINRECGSLPDCRIFTLSNMIDSAGYQELRDGALAALRGEARRNPEAIRALGGIAREHPEYRQRIAGLLIDIFENDTEGRLTYGERIRAVLPDIGQSEERTREAITENSMRIYRALAGWRSEGWGRRDAAVAELGTLIMIDARMAGRIVPVLETASMDGDENVVHMAREALFRYANSGLVEPGTAVAMLEDLLLAAKNEHDDIQLSGIFGQHEYGAHGRETRAISALMGIARREPSLRAGIIDVLEGGYRIGETHELLMLDGVDILTLFFQGASIAADSEEITDVDLIGDDAGGIAWSEYQGEGSAMAVIAIMDGTGHQLLDRILGIFENAASGGDEPEDAVFQLKVIGLDERTDDATRERIMGFLERAMAAETQGELAIPELIDLGADARTAPSARHDIVMALLRRIGSSEYAEDGVVSLTGMDCADMGGIINGMAGMLSTEDVTLLQSVVDVLGRMALRDSTGSDVRNDIARVLAGEVPRIARLGGDEAMETVQEIIACPDIDPEISRTVQERMGE